MPRRRADGAGVRISPERPLLPTESVTAMVTLDESLDGVTDARIEIGYVNTYRYEWARAGYDRPGGYKDASDWVAAVAEPITHAGGTLMAGTYTATLRIPSWAPPSGMLVRWVARLAVQRSGRAPEAEGTFTVLSPAPDPLPAETRLVQGESAIANDLHFALETDAPAYRVGSEVRGVISVTPTAPVTRSAKADVRFFRPQISHPLERNPSPRFEWTSRPPVGVADDLALVQGVTTRIPFAITLPADAEPSAEAVHSSLEWWLLATVTFAGMTGGIERARREIIVHNA